MTNTVVKITGMAVLMCSSVAYGWVKIAAEREKIRETAAFADFIGYIRDNIEHFSKPLPEICDSYNNRYFDRKGITADIRARGICMLADGYMFLMNADDSETVIKFAREIGNGYIDNELRLCSYCLGKLEASVKMMKEDIKTKEKMYKTIPPLLAASAVLLFI